MSGPLTSPLGDTSAERGRRQYFPRNRPKPTRRPRHSPSIATVWHTPGDLPAMLTHARQAHPGVPRRNRAPRKRDLALPSRSCLHPLVFRQRPSPDLGPRLHVELLWHPPLGYTLQDGANPRRLGPEPEELLPLAPEAGVVSRHGRGGPARQAKAQTDLDLVMWAGIAMNLKSVGPRRPGDLHNSEASRLPHRKADRQYARRFSRIPDHS
jgi:hypothetical protein